MSRPFFVTLLTAASLLVATWPTTAKESPPGGEPATAVAPADPVLAEFLAVANGIEDSSDPFHGRLQIPNLERRLALTDAEAYPPQAAALRGQLSFEYLRLGEIEKATEHMEAVFAMGEKLKLPPTPLMYRLKIMVELRKAELANCLAHRNKDCCLFPLSGGGVHQDKAPALRAQQALLALLKDQPNHLDGQWLLNLTAMATGDYPDQVPEPFRLPPKSLGPEAPLGRFVDVAPALGLDALNLCGGAVAEDFDNDGFLDLATSTSDPRGHLLLYRNRGNGKFDEISEAAGLRNQLGGLNCLGADYDNDGDVDLLVLRGGWMGRSGQIRNSLLRNNGPAQSGAVTFTDVTREAGLAEPAYPTQTAVWADFDNDGDLDLFIGNESDGGEDPASGVHASQLFRNNGDGTFTDIAETAGVRNDRLAKGATAGDYDNDGDLDLYVSNIGANRLYRNDTPREANAALIFTDVASELGVTAPNPRSFAPFFFDFNNDGWLDLFVTAYDATTGNLMRDYRGEPHLATPPRLYLNREGRFEDVTRAAGLDHAWLPMGASFGDVDNDGFLDIYLGTGDPAFDTLMPNVLLRNDHGQRVQNVSTAAGLGHLQKGHGICFADFDHDGDQDLFHQLGGFFPSDKYHNAFFLNPGNKNHWLTLELQGTKSNRSAIGTRLAVTVKTPNGTRTIHRAVGSVSSFAGSPVSRQELGLGDATSIVSVIIKWPRTEETAVYTQLPLDGAVRIVEGNPKFEILPLKKLAFPKP